MCHSKRIFISVASYRDPELRATILYASKLAKYPENLVFAICHQRDKKDKWDNIDDIIDDRFRVLEVDYKKAESVCVARSDIQQLYSNEDFYFQIDSHTRFVRHWDEKLLNTYEKLKKSGVEKPLISSYAPPYFPKNDPDGRSKTPLYLTFSWITPEGVPYAKPHNIDDWQKRKEPIPCGWLSGHFLFVSGEWVKEVPYDREIYFQGEEPTLAARSYTSGYDIFAPVEVICWHEYTRDDKKKVWQDHPEQANKRERVSLKRIKGVLGIDGTKRIYTIYGRGLGGSRSFDEYQNFVGVDFENRRLKKHTIAYKHPPCPKKAKWYDYQRHCLDVQKSHFTYVDDYNFWVIEYRGKEGELIHKRELSSNEIKGIMASGSQKLTIWTEFYGKKPHSVFLGANSKKDGWIDELFRDL